MADPARSGRATRRDTRTRYERGRGFWRGDANFPSATFDRPGHRSSLNHHSGTTTGGCRLEDRSGPHARSSRTAGMTQDDACTTAA